MDVRGLIIFFLYHSYPKYLLRKFTLFYVVLGEYCLPVYEDLPATLQTAYDASGIASLMSSATQYIEDLISAWPAYIIALFTCLLLLFLYSVFIKYCAWLMAWLSYILIFVFLVGLGVFTYTYGQNNYASDSDTQTILLITSYVIWGIALLYVILVICFYKDVRKSIAILQAAGAFMAGNMQILLVPLYSILFTILFLVFWLCAFVCLFSVGTISSSTTAGSQMRSVAWSETTRILVYYLSFGLLWIVALVLACNFFVISCCVCSWYFTSTSDTRGKVEIFRSIGWTLRYNLGSLAFGSFILAVVWLIRIIFEYVAAKLKAAESDGNPMNFAIKCVVCCCRCCLACVNRFVKFLTENAYVQVALNCDSFCTAAYNSFMMVLKNAATYALTETMGTIIITLGKFLISLGNTLILFVVITKAPFISTEINSPFAPSILIFIISFTFTSIFLSIYNVSSTSIMQCFIVDVEISKKEGRDHVYGDNRPEELSDLIQNYTSKKDERDEKTNAVN